jgi:hypothetical protein
LRSGPDGPSRWRWPTTSSSDRGRSRAASGARAARRDLAAAANKSFGSDTVANLLRSKLGQARRSCGFWTWWSRRRSAGVEPAVRDHGRRQASRRHQPRAPRDRDRPSRRLVRPAARRPWHPAVSTRVEGLGAEADQPVAARKSPSMTLRGRQSRAFRYRAASAERSSGDEFLGCPLEEGGIELVDYAIGPWPRRPQR